MDVGLYQDTYRAGLWLEMGRRNVGLVGTSSPPVLPADSSGPPCLCREHCDAGQVESLSIRIYCFSLPCRSWILSLLCVDGLKVTQFRFPRQWIKPKIYPVTNFYITPCSLKSPSTFSHERHKSQKWKSSSQPPLPALSLQGAGASCACARADGPPGDAFHPHCT